MIIDVSKHFKEYNLGSDDCWGLVIDIHRENGIELPRFLDVNSAKKRNGVKEFLIDNLTIKELQKPTKGAIILLKGNPWHCGICLDDKRYLHRKKDINTRIDRIKDVQTQGLYMVTQKVS